MRKLKIIFLKTYMCVWRVRKKPSLFFLKKESYNPNCSTRKIPSTGILSSNNKGEENEKLKPGQ